MKTSIQNLSFTKTCCVLAGLGASLITSTAAPPQIIQATSVYLAPTVNTEQRQTGKMLHATTVAPVVMVTSQNALFNGMLTWKGDFTQDADGNFVGSGTGELLVGTWDTSLVFHPTGDKWATHFEVRGNLATSYVGKVVCHGVEGVVEGMVTNEDFTGGPVDFFGIPTIGEEYTIMLVTPSRGK